MSGVLVLEYSMPQGYFYVSWTIQMEKDSLSFMKIFLPNTENQKFVGRDTASEWWILTPTF